jgi:ribokinase
MIRLVVLGDLNLDVLVRSSRVVPRDGEVRSSVRAVPGGSAANVARVARTAGADVIFVGSVGTDAVGDLLIRSLLDLGIDVRVRRVSEPSGTVVSLEQEGGKTMFCSRGANDGLDVASLDEALFAEADHLHVSGYALLSSAQRPAAHAALEAARTAKITSSVGLVPANLIRGFGAASFLHEMGAPTLVFLNHAEGTALTGSSEPERIVDALSQRFRGGALTLGDAGSLAWDGSARNRRAGLSSLSVDPTGAGDAFSGGFLVSYLTRGDLGRANADGEAAAAAFLREGR